MQKDYKYMLKAYSQAGGNSEIFKDSKIAHLVVHKNKVLGSHLVEGLILEPQETAQGVDITFRVIAGYKIAYPVHLCFGVLPKEGLQKINIKGNIEQNAGITIIAHCIFPNSVKVQHLMEAEIVLDENAFFNYNEFHFHGETGGAEVFPHAKIKVGKNSHLNAIFTLLKGRVGKLDIDYAVEVEEKGITEMIAKVIGYGEDRIKVREAAKLLGSGARGLIKSRVAVKENAQSEVISELIATAPEARGHVDCIEVVQGDAQARAIPIVNVTNEFAQVTHEAAIGRVDKKQVETLMARGLEQEEAIDLVIRGMLR